MGYPVENHLFHPYAGALPKRDSSPHSESESLGGGERKETLKKYDNTIFVTFEGGCPRNEEYVVPYSQLCNLGRVAENDGGQKVRVHDMRRLTLRPVMHSGRTSQ